jgi:hypothetical protein
MVAVTSIVAMGGLALKFLPMVLRMMGAKKSASAVGGILEQFASNELSQKEMEIELAEVLVNAEAEMAEHQASVVLAEVNAEGWLQRNWRPMVALSSFFSYLYVIIIYPHLVHWGYIGAVGFGEAGLQNLYYLTLTCVGGYIGSRGIEKVAKTLKGI